MKFHRLFVLSVLLAAGATGAEPSSVASKFAGATPLEWSVRLAQSEMARRGGASPKPKWDYTVGLFAHSIMLLGERVGDAAMPDHAAKSVGGLIAADGTIAGYKLEEYNIDSVAPGRAVLDLFERTGEERYRKAAETLRRQLATHPRTSDGGFWHKQRYPQQMWLDGLYMGGPFLADYARLFKEPAALDDVAKQILLMDAHAWDAKAGLHHHAWDEARAQSWADKKTGTSPCFWGRSIGWYSMALVDVLDYLPASHPDVDQVVGVLRRVADGIARYQDAKTGLWWQVVDQGGRAGNYIEATASSMFVYSLAKAVNRGYLPRDRYLPVIRRGYEGLVRDLVETGADGRVNLLQCCSVAGLGYTNAAGRPRDGTYDYYISEPIVKNDLKGVGPFILAGLEVDRLFAAGGAASAARGTGPVTWDTEAEILTRIHAPTFPDRPFPVIEYGAVGDGKTDCTDAIARAIAACNAAGGGRVVVPSGRFLTGAVHLKSNVNLVLAEGATLVFSPDPARYPVVFTRWEGVECMNYSPLLYAYEQENIAVTGRGTLDGSAGNDNWWGWNLKEAGQTARQTADRNRLFELGEQGVPVAERVFGPGHFLRPNFFQPYRCTNVLIEGVRIRNSPMWEVHPVLCTNVIVRGLDILSHGPNNDGCNPESSRDVLIENCVFDTGDDCIAIKSGRNTDGRRVAAPSENIVIRGCSMKDGHGGVVLGSEISGHCRNVFIEDCTMDSPNLDRALRFKDNAVRGGVLENVFMRNVRIGRVSEAVLTIDLLYEEGSQGSHMPVVRNVVLENVTSEASPRVMFIAGFEGATIERIRFAQCVFRGVEAAEMLSYARSVALEDVTIEPAKKSRSLNSPEAAVAK